MSAGAVARGRAEGTMGSPMCAPRTSSVGRGRTVRGGIVSGAHSRTHDSAEAEVGLRVVGHGRQGPRLRGRRTDLSTPWDAVTRAEAGAAGPLPPLRTRRRPRRHPADLRTLPRPTDTPGARKSDHLGTGRVRAGEGRTPAGGGRASGRVAGSPAGRGRRVDRGRPGADTGRAHGSGTRVRPTGSGRYPCAVPARARRLRSSTDRARAF